MNVAASVADRARRQNSPRHVPSLLHHPHRHRIRRKIPLRPVLYISQVQRQPDHSGQRRRAQLGRRQTILVQRPQEALQEAGFPLYTERVERSNRWMFVDTFNFKVPVQPLEITLNKYGEVLAHDVLVNLR